MSDFKCRRISVCGIKLFESIFIALPKKAEANFSIGVEVWVEANLVAGCAHELHTRRVDGIVVRTSNVEVEEAPFIRSVERPRD